MKPIAHTIEAVREIGRATGETGLLASLQDVADSVEAIVPDCLGLSITWSDEHVTFTLLASAEEIAVFDALQYLDGGPCVESIRRREGLVTDHESLMDEARWQLFALGTAASGVRSTLTMPLTRAGRIVGSVNLYGASDQAFEGHHDSLAEVLGAWAPGAIRNADLTFATRELAAQTPQSLREQGLLNRAIAMLALRGNLDLASAEERIRDAAARAGVKPAQLAEAILRMAG